jgi:hypothetical protein
VTITMGEPWQWALLAGFFLGAGFVLGCIIVMVKRLERQLGEHTHLHYYASYACVHGDHNACVPCDRCDEPCRCPTPGCPHRYRPVRRVVKSWTVRLPAWVPIPGRERRKAAVTG